MQFKKADSFGFEPRRAAVGEKRPENRGGRRGLCQELWIQAFAEKKNGLWVACAEHLVILKLDALKSRRHSDKGDKDTEDILVLTTCAKLERTSILKRHLLSEDWALLFDIVDTPGNWQKLTQNNYKKASALQKEAQATLKALRPGDVEIE